MIFCLLPRHEAVKWNTFNIHYLDNTLPIRCNNVLSKSAYYIKIKQSKIQDSDTTWTYYEYFQKKV